MADTPTPAPVVPADLATDLAKDHRELVSRFNALLKHLAEHGIHFKG